MKERILSMLFGDSKSHMLILCALFVLLPGCRHSGKSVDVFDYEMRSVEVGPMKFNDMSALDVMSILQKEGNLALREAGSEFGFSVTYRYDKHLANQKRKWRIPRVPILDAFKYVCDSCGASMKYENGRIDIVIR